MRGGNKISFFPAWARRWLSSPGVAKTLRLHLSPLHSIVSISLGDSPLHLRSPPPVPHRKSGVQPSAASSRITRQTLRALSAQTIYTDHIVAECFFFFYKSDGIFTERLMFADVLFLNIYISDIWRIVFRFFFPSLSRIVKINVTTWIKIWKTYTK